MNIRQYEVLVRLLTEIRDRLPEPSKVTIGPIKSTVRNIPESVTWPIPIPAIDVHDGPDTYPTAQPRLGAPGRRGAHQALINMLAVAEDWAEGARDNDEAMGRRDIRLPEEQPFLLEDIRRMVNDAAAQTRIDPIWKDSP